MTTGYWIGALVDQLEFHWGIVRPRLDSLTDDEYLWEPVDGCWSIRRRADATTSHAAGAGDTVLDDAWPAPDPAPVTTIAWRLAHIAIPVFGTRAANHFGDGSVDEASTDFSLAAAGGLALLDHHHDAWINGVRALDDDGLARAVGPAEGPWAEAPMSDLILHINREAIHHAAEVLLLRDLYRTRFGAPSS